MEEGRFYRNTLVSARHDAFYHLAIRLTARPCKGCLFSMAETRCTRFPRRNSARGVRARTIEGDVLSSRVSGLAAFTPRQRGGHFHRLSRTKGATVSVALFFHALFSRKTHVGGRPSTSRNARVPSRRGHFTGQLTRDTNMRVKYIFRDRSPKGNWIPSIASRSSRLGDYLAAPTSLSF